MSHRSTAAEIRLSRPGLPLISLIAAFVAALIAAFITIPVQAENPRFQNYFFEVCAGADGLLEARCAETDGGLGDLSSDSESSLNPSQTLGVANAARSTARSRAREAHERGEDALTEGAADTGDGGLALKPLSLLVNGRLLSEERSRQVDVDAERGYQMDARGAQLGLDYRFNRDFVAGGMFTWETSSLDYDRERPGQNFTPAGRAGSVDQDSLGATLFANLRLGRSGYLDVSGGYIDSDYTIRRSAVFQESNRTVPQTLVQTQAAPGGDETWAALALGTAITRDAWNFNPYLGATYSRAKVDGYRERDVSASGLALDVGSITADSLLGQAGLRITRPISRPGYVLLPQFSVEYLHEFERDGVSSDIGFQLDQDGNRLRLEGDRRDTGYVDVGVGLVMLLPNGWMPFIEYQITLGQEDLNRNRVALGLRVEL